METFKQGDIVLQKVSEDTDLDGGTKHYNFVINPSNKEALKKEIEILKDSVLKAKTGQYSVYFGGLSCITIRSLQRRRDSLTSDPSRKFNLNLNYKAKLKIKSQLK